MIRDRVTVSRYAEAFLGYCRESIGIDKALSDLKKVEQIMRDNPELKEFLESPGIAYREKYGIIDEVFKEELSDEVRHLLKLLIENRRFGHFFDIADYMRIEYSHQDKEEALIKTSYPLDLELIKKIEDGLEKKFNKKFKFYIELDSRLLGGVQIVMGNTIIDGSVRSRLNNLKEKLKALEVV